MNERQYDAVMLLGGGVGLDGSLPDTAKAVLDKAAELYRDHTVSAIIVCGSYGYKAIEKPVVSEAEAYASYLKSLDIPASAIHLEMGSKETFGNILFAKMRILMGQQWHHVLVMPAINHSTERIEYILEKILGDSYSWDILRVGENTEPANLVRESKSLAFTKQINDRFTDGDHAAMYTELLATHPAYGGTKWTIDELRKGLGS